MLSFLFELHFLNSLKYLFNINLIIILVGSLFINDCLINLLTSKLVYTVHWEFSTAQALHISLVSESISHWSIAVKANLRPFKRDVLKWPIPVTAWWHCADSCYYLPIESTLFIHPLPHQTPLFTTSLILLSVIHQHTEHAWNGRSFASERALLLYIVSDLDVFSRFTLWTYFETTSSKSICLSLLEMFSFAHCWLLASALGNVVLYLIVYDYVFVSRILQQRPLQRLKRGRENQSQSLSTTSPPRCKWR